MIQRYLYTALKAGLREAIKDPRIIEDLFKDHFSLGATEVAAIHTFFKDNLDPDKDENVVRHGYARSDMKMPMYAITLSNEDEKEHFLHDDAPDIVDPSDESFGSDLLSAFWGHTYQIMCYSEHPDGTTYMYEMVKSIMVAAENFFSDEGMFDIHISGRELAPDANYAPEHLYVRQLTFTAKREFLRIDHTARLTKAFRVSGIHVDKGGSSSDVGGVKTNVTVIEPEE